MDRKEIAGKLIQSHTDFVNLVKSLNDNEFMLGPNGKWTAGQQLEHIYLSVKPVNMALSLPKLVPRLAFGKANRPSVDYDTLVRKYQAKLEKGGVAPGSFVPKPVTISQRENISNKVSDTVAKLCRNIESYNEQQLDEYILPHPLLGKLTLREMLYFTIYHVGHHQNLVKKNLLS